MKTAATIGRQEAKKETEKRGDFKGRVSQNSDSVSEGRRRRLANLKPFTKGVSGNPGGKPKVDLAAQIARAIFENDGPAIYDAFAKMLRKGSPYAFQVLSDRAFGKLKETHAHEISPYHDMSNADIQKRIAELEQRLGVTVSQPEVLPPADSDSESKPNWWAAAGLRIRCVGATIG